MTVTNVRALTSEGIDLFRAALAARREGAAPDRLEPLDGSVSTVVTADARIDPALTFATKLELGAYLAQVLAPLRGDPRLDHDPGIWSWIVLLYLDQFCPSARKPLEDAHYIPVAGRNRHRH